MDIPEIVHFFNELKNRTPYYLYYLNFSNKLGEKMLLDIFRIFTGAGKYDNGQMLIDQSKVKEFIDYDLMAAVAYCSELNEDYNNLINSVIDILKENFVKNDEIKNSTM
jgi:hypothetical protein